MTPEEEIRLLHNSLRMCQQWMTELIHDRESGVNWQNMQAACRTATATLCECGGFNRYVVKPTGPEPGEEDRT